MSSRFDESSERGPDSKLSRFPPAGDNFRLVTPEDVPPQQLADLMAELREKGWG